MSSMLMHNFGIKIECKASQARKENKLGKAFSSFQFRGNLNVCGRIVSYHFWNLDDLVTAWELNLDTSTNLN